VTAIKGPDGSEPSQFGEVTAFAIANDAKRDAAERFVEFMMSDGYVDWLAFAPEGKFPDRTGTKDKPGAFTAAWDHLRTGVDRKEPLSEIYPPDVLKVLRTSTETMNRWGFPQGQGRLVGAQLDVLPIPAALAAALDGRLDEATAAEQAQADMEKIARSVK
jgi:multiple sugar transport system substrate-binding protein